MTYTVCIQAAGIGSRLTIAEGLHKALIPINNKSVLSRIIDLYPAKSKFVILVGYKKEQLKAFINITYPHYNIEYVEIKNFSGEGSGPGFSLLQAKKHISGPFIFMACDTLVFERPPLPKYNWIGVSNTNSSKNYLVAEVQDGLVTSYYDKKDEQYIYSHSKSYDENREKPFDTFIGLAGIYDHDVFWQALEHDKKKSEGEIQVSNGLNALIKNPLGTKVHKFKWIDTGSDKNYSRAREYFKDNFLLKTDEFLYKEKNKIIKFFLDTSRATKRFERTKFLNETNPKTYQSGENFIWYEFVRGTLISNTDNDSIFSNFLVFMNETIWKKRVEDKASLKSLEAKAYNFYKIKTFERVRRFNEINNEADNIKYINNNPVQPINTLLEKIDWVNLSKGSFAKFHGDPQPENVIVENKNKFVLIDWREDFGGDLKHGDIYYDFGKIYHSLIITHKKIRENKFSSTYNDKSAYYKFSKRRNLMRYLCVFEQFLKTNNYDIQKVRLISAIIYLNIAPLHHHPYSDLLFFHGKLELSKLLR